MYDPVTAALIRSAPAVSGYSLTDLPELLSDAQVHISTVRLRLAEGVAQPDGETGSLLSQLRTLAASLELHACLAPVREDRRAAAFVAATSYRMLFEAGELFAVSRSRQELTAASVSSDISAALLFLAAGYPADAAEIIGRPISARGSAAATVSEAVARIARGDLEAILGLSIEVSADTAGEERAVDTLWQRILWAVAVLAQRLLATSTRADASWDAIIGRLEEVRSLSAHSFFVPGLPGEVPTAISVFSGPHHLATLLIAAIRGLEGGALVDSEPPAGIGGVDWTAFLRTRARKKPYLWTNHADAVRQGLLNTGRSATISFPTGAGKSTLSELKIATHVIGGRKVVYVVPTLALVAQVGASSRELMESIGTNAGVEESEHEDKLYLDFDEPLRGEIWVMTPERCLLLQGLFPERFAEVGLIVFDECHMVHPDSEGLDRRSLDAMLCLLKLLAVAPTADVLLMSAMMSNGAELAKWLRDCHGKDALSFDAAWKPTRQARASLMFDRAEMDALLAMAQARIDQGKTIPQAKMRALPYTLVGLKQTWESNRGADYRILRLSDTPTGLTAKRDGDGVSLWLDSTMAAASIAAQGASKGLKSIVFVRSTSSVLKAVRESVELTGRTMERNEQEEELFAAMTLELGGAEFVITPEGDAGGHFGSLFQMERDLVESSFRRVDGIRVLFSTNTLAQGMNLPADQVIIARTGAYNPETEKYSQIDVHELLNAAGRAGRAGHAANGFVLVIPDRLVDFDARSRVVGGRTINRLKNNVLAQDDRCLKIGDPIELLLDACALAPEAPNESLDSLLLRLPPSTEDEPARAVSRRFLASTLAAQSAANAGNAAAFELKVAEAISRQARLFDGVADQRTFAICSATGLRPTMVSALVVRLQAVSEPETMGPAEWARWTLSWLSESLELGTLLKLGDMPPADVTLTALRLWISGTPLVEIERTLGTAERALKKLDRARKFVKGTIREVSYLVGLIAQIARSTELPQATSISESASLAALLLREGFDRLDKLILFQSMRDSKWTRVRAHQEAPIWLAYVEPSPGPSESYEDGKRRVSHGLGEYRRRRGAD